MFRQDSRASVIQKVEEVTRNCRGQTEPAMTLDIFVLKMRKSPAWCRIFWYDGDTRWWQSGKSWGGELLIWKEADGRFHWFLRRLFIFWFLSGFFKRRSRRKRIITSSPRRLWCYGQLFGNISVQGENKQENNQKVLHCAGFFGMIEAEKVFRYSSTAICPCV